MSFIEYFGLRLKEKEDGMQLTRENLLNVNTGVTLNPKRKGEHYTNQEQFIFKEKALQNFDCNMTRYSKLNGKLFNNYVKSILTSFPTANFVTNLTSFEKKSGVYIMILDNYSQLYIGGSKDIALRIRQHWTNKMAVDRLIFGSVQNSKLSIDSFRALDTTRIIIIEEANWSDLEVAVSSLIPNEMNLQRTANGNLDGGLPEAIMKRKTYKEQSTQNRSYQHSTYHTYEFYYKRRNDPKWRHDYLIAHEEFLKKQKIIAISSVIIVSILLLIGTIQLFLGS